MYLSPFSFFYVDIMAAGILKTVQNSVIVRKELRLITKVLNRNPNDSVI